MKKYQKLFDYMADEHGVILLEYDMNELVVILKGILEEEKEPYFGYCDVKECYNEAVNGGGCWRSTGRWNVCSNHSKDFRNKKPQPEMKQSAIDRESRRGEDGFLKPKKLC